MAKEELIATWKCLGESIEPISVNVTSVQDNIATEDQIKNIIDSNYSGSYVVGEKEYGNVFEYWKATGYEPYNDTWIIYTVRGDYHMAESIMGNVVDYEGGFKILVLCQSDVSTWSIWKTEVDVPDELKSFLPD